MRHDGFIPNVFVRVPPSWTHIAQRLIGHYFIHRILPQVTKNYTKVPISKPDDPLIGRPNALNYDLETFLIGWISDKIFEGLELAHTLPSYITAYRKGKSINFLTLIRIMFLENA